jgi:predicted small secreted protein
VDSRPTRLGAILAAAAILAGCGATGFGQDVKGFTQQATTPLEQSVLRSIATYRTTKDAKAACSLITTHFLTIRFDGKTQVCEAIARHQTKHDLPKSAEVESVAGASATVRIAEPTATRSLYKMKQEGGTWKIDDIVEAH